MREPTRRPQDVTLGALRLTGGTARGVKLYSVSGRDVRPALARMRVSIFEILKTYINEAQCLDLFAGNGTLGLEALSRGAAHCIFIEIDPRPLAALKLNLERLRMTDRAEIIEGDALDVVSRLTASIDLVFVDPPYALYDDPLRVRRLEEVVRQVPGDALILVEHRASHDLGLTWAGRVRTEHRHYGGTHVSIYGECG